jgi:uncharacterized BrkB/YihY/UPF0761 family membrane protein
MLSVVPLVAVAAAVFGRFIRNFKSVQDQVAESQVIVENDARN